MVDAGLAANSSCACLLPGKPRRSPDPSRHWRRSRRSAPRPVSVLIVDDNIDAATSLCYVITLAGYQVMVAHDGNRALEIAGELHPDVVLLDIGLPGMSGHEVARRLRAESWAADLKLIAVTGWGQEDDRTKSLEAGFDEHLTKPIDPETLLQRISRAARSAA